MSGSRSWKHVSEGSALPVRYATGFRQELVKGYTCPFHRHAGLEIVYHPSGQGTTTIRTHDATQSWSFRAGDVVVYPPFLEHQQQMLDAGVDVCIALDWTGEAEVLPPEPLVVSVGGNTYLTRELTALASTRAGLTPGDLQCLSLRGAALLASLLHAATTAHSASDTPEASLHVSRAKQLVGRSLAVILTTADAADSIGISDDYLRHLFKQHEGITFSQWLRRTRVEHARHLLERSQLPLKAIAAECGFSSDRHLCTVFKQHTGTTPGAYRRHRQST